MSAVPASSRVTATRAVSGSRLVSALTPIAQSLSVRGTPAAASTYASAQLRTASVRPTPVAASTQLRVATAARSGLARSASTSGAAYNSNVERAVIAAQQPLPSEERELVTVGPFRGVQLNRQEEQSFRGPVPLTQYEISNDANPEVLRKQAQNVRYTQEIACRRLAPPTPAPHGDLIIREKRSNIPAAPPVVLRQLATPSKTPVPQVLREQPPATPAVLPEQVVEVEGAPVPPPARRVVLEKLAPAPVKPQNVLVERWLPYKPQTRRVVFQAAQTTSQQNPRNLVIEWQQAEAEVEQVCKDLGVERVNPEEYRRQYGSELRSASEFPQLPCECGQQRPASVYNACGQRVSSGAAVSVAAGSAAGQPQLNLEGDLDALKLVDLDKYGLGEYRRFLQ